MKFKMKNRVSLTKEEKGITIGTVSVVLIGIMAIVIGVVVSAQRTAWLNNVQLNNYVVYKDGDDFSYELGRNYIIANALTPYQNDYANTQFNLYCDITIPVGYKLQLTYTYSNGVTYPYLHFFDENNLNIYKKQVGVNDVTVVNTLSAVNETITIERIAVNYNGIKVGHSLKLELNLIEI